MGTLEKLTKAHEFIIKHNTNFTIGTAIMLILFLVLTIMAGRILYLINATSDTIKGDPDIQSAHNWAAGMVGLSTIGLIVCIGMLIYLIYSKNPFTQT